MYKPGTLLYAQYKVRYGATKKRYDWTGQSLNKLVNVQCLPGDVVEVISCAYMHWEFWFPAQSVYIPFNAQPNALKPTPPDKCSK